MKNTYPIIILFALFWTSHLSAQVAITPDGSSAYPSAMLEIKSDEKGVLLPRMTTGERDAINSPANSLLIFNITTGCYEVFNSSWYGWEQIWCLECTLPDSPIEETHLLQINEIEWHWSEAPGATGYKYNTTEDYETATDNGNNTTYTQTGCACNNLFELYVWAYNTCGNSPPVLLSQHSASGAYIAPGQWKIFMSHNLGAEYTADPATPGWQLNGGYWQWGRYGMAAYAPTATNDDPGVVGTWNPGAAPNGSWSDAVKTANDPCPSGFRVPTKAEWEGVIANNVAGNVGVWTSSPSNYSSGKTFGPCLYLPAGGSRGGATGVLTGRGAIGYYWSSTEYPVASAWALNLGTAGAGITLPMTRTYGFLVRCVAE